MNKAEFCKSVLKEEGNTHTDVVEVETTNGGYYSYVTDKIYISNTTIDVTAKDVVVLCHECRHSMQDKRLHLLNVVLSNIEIILFVAITLYILFAKFSMWCVAIYLTCNILSIVVRCILELPVMLSSFDMAKKYCDSQMRAEIECKQKQSKKMLPLGILSFTWSRIFRICLVIVLSVIV